MISNVLKRFLNKKESLEESIRRLEHFVWKIDLIQRDTNECVSGHNVNATATQLIFYQQSLGEIGLGFKISANVDYWITLPIKLSLVLSRLSVS